MFLTFFLICLFSLPSVALLSIVNINAYGTLHNGGWNSLLAEKGCFKVTPSVAFIQGHDGDTYWLSGVSSLSSRDDSLLGLVTVNTRTGESQRYATPGGGDEKAVTQAINSAVSNYEGFRAGIPILYELYGQLAWISPVTANGQFKMLAVVQADNMRVALGKTKQEALRAYQRQLVSNGTNFQVDANMAAETLTTTILRQQVISSDEPYVYLRLEAKPQSIFMVPLSLSQSVALARPGDKATVSFYATKDDVISVSTFKLHVASPKDAF
jgi:hypothetical protein